MTSFRSDGDLQADKNPNAKVSSQPLSPVGSDVGRGTSSDDRRKSVEKFCGQGEEERHDSPQVSTSNPTCSKSSR
jgi:hypothetical protein